MTAAVEYRNVKMAYGEREIIPDLSLAIDRGEFITIIGSSGCGKTTILKMANGLVMPTGGDVLVNGQSVKDADLVALRRTIGYAIQGSALFPHLTVEKNIAYVPELMNRHNRKGTRRAVEKWLKICGLDRDLLKRYPRELSGGQQQRVGIARALAASPQILLMDEPFSAVDEITRASLQKEIRRIHAETGITVMFVTHDINEALLLGDRLLVLDSGKLQQFASPAEILKNPANSFVKRLVGGAAQVCAQAENRGAANASS